MKILRIGFALLLVSIAAVAADTETPVKENDPRKEAPNVLYIVPWNETPTQKAKDPKLVLHNLVGDLYEPQIPSDW